MFLPLPYSLASPWLLEKPLGAQFLHSSNTKRNIPALHIHVPLLAPSPSVSMFLPCNMPGHDDGHWEQALKEDVCCSDMTSMPLGLQDKHTHCRKQKWWFQWAYGASSLPCWARDLDARDRSMWLPSSTEMRQTAPQEWVRERILFLGIQTQTQISLWHQANLPKALSNNTY